MKIFKNVPKEEYRELINRNLEFLTIYEDEKYMFIGPLVKTDKDPCFICFENSLRDNKSKYNKRVEEILNNKNLECDKYDYNLYYKLYDRIKDNLIGNVFILDKSNWSLEKKKIYKHGMCNVCPKIEYGEEFFADIDMEREFSSCFRSKSINEIISNKIDSFNGLIDMDTGIGQFEVRDIDSRIIPMYYIKSNICSKEYYSYGRTFDLIHSKYSAVFEMIERHSSMVPNSKDYIIDSYNNLINKGFNLIGPERFTLPSKEQFNEEGYNLYKYDKEKNYSWQKVFDIANNKFVYIPEQIVFFDNQLIRNEERYIYETSNGCAVGSTKEEAILYALLEVIERDNFLVHWYNKLSPQKLDIRNIKNNNIKKLINYIENKGFKIHILNITLESNIPAIWAMIEDVSANSNVKCYNAAGAHINPEKALEAALVEIVTSVFIYNNILKQEGKDIEVKELEDNPNKIIDMEQHVYFYSNTNNFKYIKFAIENDKIVDFKEAFNGWYSNTDKKYNLSGIINKLKNYHKEIFISNMTTDLNDELGLYCVKAIIPTMLTMTFGHSNRRINKERVKSAPVIAKLREKSILEGEIYSMPHPFP